jgi:hypothetical protein
MKKTILILVGILAICGGYYYHNTQNEKKMLIDFAYEVVDHNVKINDIATKYIKYNKLGKEIAVLLLEHYRKGYDKNNSDVSIKVYSYLEAIKSGKEIGNVSENYNYNKVFFLYLNDKVQIPILLNDESKIIAISFGLDKGGSINYFMRLDGEKKLSIR